MSNLLGAVEIREIAERIGVRPTKKLGQNFVVDANTCRKIVKSADVRPTDVALEIGPGLGSLTLAMMESAREVVAIEIDDRLAAELPETAKRHGFDTIDLTIINEDAMNISTLPIEPTVLVANLPYNVSVPVLLRFLELFPTLRSGVVMVQSEVADRLVAKPNSKTYGSPSVKATWWADLTSAGTVSRSIFWPVPNVDSSLVRFVRHQSAGDEALRKVVFKIIDAAFAQRRKMMRAALSDMCGGSAAASSIIEASGIDPTIRGEALELADFIKIAITLSK
ncbi:MAG: 16S rRNA (adenine(1518)-N(6)/adenine(1519)-N(6))-dimethyltransferase RsmA [Actinobacteria bacterium]|jgi:16S rRNA (adenine1518-N6/adenine1519-N6)-dimethyltransferase|nr:16S rRNA (adenine(1518)-N(6)/adenine(1519)-N(6))-dimethyltransferase RsmA [Actinomycetota bacterium]MDA2982002.1 16S rRNA (adenine(1518)-N(6)/adenine(1519)-N(6))-dimethyltransferase RsmA [Actinomycetota bacterium]MDA2997095.1 16S rRNA (adenine(1518)-N(6)/adenine(1519)-N(6))-dimethyltransferase RsmA [Actinomycetota bacterium]